MQTVQLVPVSQWVYDLYEVSFWVGDPDNGGRVVKAAHIAASCENHLQSDANEACPGMCDYYTWKLVKENVGHPRVVGNMYGQPVHESGRCFGERLKQQM